MPDPEDSGVAVVVGEADHARTQARRKVRRRRKHYRLIWMIGCATVILPGLMLCNWWSGEPQLEAASDAAGRHLLQTPTPATASPTRSPTTEDSSLYPPDLFTKKQRENGAILLHIMGVFYMFAGLAIVCDDYFVPALEVITERLQLSDDVAGATFMAAGGSAPELFTSVIGVFIAKSNVGFGTIVGSAVFNVLFVIGACAVATIGLASDLAKKEAERSGGEMAPWYHWGLPLTSWPLLRDSVFYAVDLAVLLVFFLDEEVWWYEALVMLCLYGIYVLFMKFNEQAFEIYQQRVGSKVSPHEEVQVQGSKDAAGSNRRVSQAAEEQQGLTRQESRSVIKKTHREVSMTQRRESRHEARRSSRESEGNNKKEPSEGGSGGGGDEDDDDDDGPWEPGSAWTQAETLVDKLKYVFFFPLNIVLWSTVPNCQDDDSKKYYIAAFVLSICWIAVFSYFMVWWAEVCGEVVGIPPEVMGLTFLAAGTSVPDLITSMVVARAGHGDMAVSSSIGSNIFDVCFGLPLPWFLYGITVNKGQDSIEVKSNSLGSSVLMLFGMLIATIGCIIAFGWKLNIALGATSVLLYCVFMTFTLLIQYDKVDSAI